MSAIDPVTGGEVAATAAINLAAQIQVEKNAPAMIQAAEAAQEQAEVDEDNRAVAKAQRGDLEELRERSS